MAGLVARYLMDSQRRVQGIAGRGEGSGHRWSERKAGPAVGSDRVLEMALIPG